MTGDDLRFHVYAFKDVSTGYVKIGRSASLSVRQYELGRVFNATLELIGLFSYASKNESANVENYLLQQFAHARSDIHPGREWFLPDVAAKIPKSVDPGEALTWLIRNHAPYKARCRRAWSVRRGCYVQMFDGQVIGEIAMPHSDKANAAERAPIRVSTKPKPIPERKPHATQRLTDDQILSAIRKHRSGVSACKVGAEFGLSAKQVQDYSDGLLISRLSMMIDNEERKASKVVC